MKVVILAGGFGTRLSELTGLVPKPMVDIAGVPIILHLMQVYSRQGFNDFVLALGYKSDYIKDYFLNSYIRNNDLSINLNDGSIEMLSNRKTDWSVSMIDTGLNTMTGGRIKRLSKYLNATFMLTYGDGLANINLKELINSHLESKKKATMTIVNPSSKYGKVQINQNGSVTDFYEKPKFNNDWINGGFMVLEPEVLDLISGDESSFEEAPMRSLVNDCQLNAFKHNGLWKCMDTLRDKKEFDLLAEMSPPPWYEGL